MSTAKTKAATESTGFSDFERAAMKQRALELKAEKNREMGEKMLLDKVAEMPESDQVMAKKIHAIVKKVAPMLTPKTWYGMPAYANADGKVVCFFQSAKKFEARYSTLGFNDPAKLDVGTMWPTAFGLTKIGEAEEKRIAELITKAVS